MSRLWNWFWYDTSKPVFAGVLFVAGIVVWGAFNTAMEATNTMTFCVSCHEMRDNVFTEYKETVHYHNRTGVRAVCSDCHVPNDWIGKVVRKIKASSELYHWALGTINTPEKFNAKRLQLARKVWIEMKDNNSRECRNCHDYSAMHWEKQGNRAKATMKDALKENLACIDCHKGIAHKLPDFTKHYAGLAQGLKDSIAKDNLSGGRVTAIAKVTAYMKNDEGSGEAFEAMPLAEMAVIKKEGDWLNVRLIAWDREGGLQLFKKPGPQMQIAKLGADGMDVAKASDHFVDKETELTWNKITIEGWVKKGVITSNSQAVTDYAQELWRTDCALCHSLYEPTRYLARDWVKEIKAMRRFTKLEPEMLEVVLMYLQNGSKDMVAAGK